MSYQEDRLQSIADAIKLKSGNSAPIAANDFAFAILNLPTGGSTATSGVEVFANSGLELLLDVTVEPTSAVTILEE